MCTGMGENCVKNHAFEVGKHVSHCAFCSVQECVRRIYISKSTAGACALSVQLSRTLRNSTNRRRQESWLQQHCRSVRTILNFSFHRSPVLGTDSKVFRGESHVKSSCDLYMYLGCFVENISQRRYPNRGSAGAAPPMCCGKTLSRRGVHIPFVRVCEKVYRLKHIKSMYVLEERGTVVRHQKTVNQRMSMNGIGCDGDWIR